MELTVSLGVGAATRTRSERGRLIQQAMSAAVLRCNANGISTEEKNSSTISNAMQQARIDMIAACDEADAAYSLHDQAGLATAGEHIQALLKVGE